MCIQRDDKLEKIQYLYFITYHNMGIRENDNYDKNMSYAIFASSEPILDDIFRYKI